MFGPVQPTEMDLQFHLFGIPVRVLPWFWLLAALLGGSLLQLNEGWKYLVAWVVVVFFSILVHELGHALTARAFGYFPRIFLYHFGGLAMYTPGSDYTAGRSILITLAGPAAGLMLGFAAYIGAVSLREFRFDVPPLVYTTVIFLVEVNVGWSILNMLPVFPLDGGQITRDVCTSMSPRRGEQRALWISTVVAGLVAAAGFLGLVSRAGISVNDRYLGFMFALMCYQNFQMLQMRRY